MEIEEEGKQTKEQTSLPTEEVPKPLVARTSAVSRATGDSNVSMGGVLVNPKHLTKQPLEKQFKTYGRISLQSNLSEKLEQRQHKEDLYDALGEEFQPGRLLFNRISVEQGECASGRPSRNAESFGWFNVEESPIKSRIEVEPTVRPEPVGGGMELMFKQNSFTVEQKPLAVEPVIPVEPQPQVKLTCKCVKSKCLQLYCQCFSKSVMCSEECSCYQCRNNELFRQKLEKARDSVLTKDPEAFSNKLQLMGNIEVATNLAYKRGCNCKRTMCTKRYCECVLSGVKCSYLCRCQGCMNGGPSGKQQ